MHWLTMLIDTYAVAIALQRRGSSRVSVTRPDHQRIGDKHASNSAQSGTCLTSIARLEITEMKAINFIGHLWVMEWHRWHAAGGFCGDIPPDLPCSQRRLTHWHVREEWLK